jgi:hypothetical protein
MFNWFYRYLGNKIHRASRDIDQPDCMPSKLATVSEDSSLCTNPITLRMYRANGGWAVEFRQYDRKSDSNETSLYVINNETELGDSISKIITMEALRR